MMMVALWPISCPVSVFVVAICDESGPGGVVVSSNAIRSLQAHGLLSVYCLGVCHHSV